MGADFHEKIIGSAGPVHAMPGSLRAEIHERWQSLGLPKQPTDGEHGLHTSASPFEAFAECIQWLQKDITRDTFGEALHQAGMSFEAQAWCLRNENVRFENKRGRLF